MMAERKISKVFCIIHPYFDKRRSVEGAKIDLDYWRAVIDRVAPDKSAILVCVDPFPGQEGAELRRYAQRRLGDRFKRVKRNDPLAGNFKSMRPALSRSAKMFACGEYVNACVAQAAEYIASDLGLPRSRVFLMPDLSTDSLGERSRVGSRSATSYPEIVGGRIEDAFPVRAMMKDAELQRLDKLRGFCVVPRHKIDDRLRQQWLRKRLRGVR